MNDRLCRVTGYIMSTVAYENDFGGAREYSLSNTVSVDTRAGNQNSSINLGWSIPVGKKDKKAKKKKTPKKKPASQKESRTSEETQNEK